MTKRVDFKLVKKEADFRAVLDHYGIEYTEKGEELGARCPFHEDSSPSFRANTEKNIFNCFGCKAKGNVLDFVARMDDVGVRTAARRSAIVCRI